MWIQLQRSHKINNKHFCIGRILNVTKDYAEDLIERDIAELYEGERPPRHKMKTNLFKPK